jgi:hypothetical protein
MAGIVGRKAALLDAENVTLIIVSNPYFTGHILKIPFAAILAGHGEHKILASMVVSFSGFATLVVAAICRGQMKIHVIKYAHDYPQ